MKLLTADALEEAARKLRSADLLTRGGDVTYILHDAETRIEQFKAEVGVKYAEMEDGYHKTMEPVETIISDHPIPSVLVAAGIGFLAGMILGKSRE